MYGSADMLVTIPRAALGIGEGDFIMNFKWSDNILKMFQNQRNVKPSYDSSWRSIVACVPFDGSAPFSMPNHPKVIKR